ncbi:MAG TPA: hypothetical protein VKU00_04335 [Chthonomonadaceae bacterium]|nr:hypothetical protein [Chthonomonadaceae bacterium]
MSIEPIWRDLLPVGLIIGAATLALLVLMSAKALRIILAQRRIKTARKGEGYAEFCAAFAGQPISECVLEAVYGTLSSDISFVRALPVRPSDSLRDIYGIDGFSGTETAELVEMIAVQCGLEVDCPTAQIPSLRTVSDLILLLGSASAVVGAPVYRALPAERPESTLRTLRQPRFH